MNFTKKALTPTTRRCLSTSNKAYDHVIMGGGAIGASIAYHLAKATQGQGVKIALLERDISYTKASYGLSAGGIRQQFSIEENINMSVYSVEFIKAMAETVQWRENGYLFCASENGEHILRENLEIQRSCGVDWMKILNSQELEQRFPWLKTQSDFDSDIVCGSISDKNEGFFDPWIYASELRRMASEMGVEFFEGEAYNANFTNNSGMDTLRLDSLNAIVKDKTLGQVDTKITAKTFINAAGAWSAKLVDTLTQKIPYGRSIVAVPVEARKRCIFNLHCPLDTAPPTSSPLTVAPCGVYFRPEGGQGRFIAGVSPDANDDPACEDTALEFVAHEEFDEKIWPALYDMVPAFENLKVISSWAGFYEFNFLDHNAIMGPHSDIDNLMLCTGFSGHGLQLSPAAGRAIAELVVYGKYQTLDLNRFSFDRIVDNKPIMEKAVI